MKAAHGSDPGSMNDLRKRTIAIQQLGERFATEAPTLTEALVSDLQFARGAAPEHIQEAAALIREWTKDDAAAVHPDVRSGERRASGAVAIQVHDDAPLTSLARALPGAFLSGASQCVVNLPPKATQTAEALRQMCRGLPGVIIRNEHSGTFLMRALTDAYTRTIWAGGNNDLLAPFGDLIQDTRSHVIFEGRGNDAIVVGADADLTVAARITAELAFRNGGIDPASPNRVYVPESLHDEFSDLLCELASDYAIAHHGDASCRITPMRTELARDQINDLLDEAEDEDAELAVGLDFRNFPEQTQPTLYPTVVTGCGGTLRIVTTRCRGPVLPVSPYSDDADLCTSLDESAGPDGQEGAAATLIGAHSLSDALGRRFSYVLSGEQGPFGAGAQAARLRWGGGPASWTITAGPEGMRRRFGPVDLTHAFSRDTLTSRARWSSRKASREEAAAAK